MTTDRLLLCPVCRGFLHEEGRTFRCPVGHAFDRAREGYLHLLPDGHGRSGKRGDVREMVEARRRFLRRGHYRPLEEAVVETVLREERDVARDAAARTFTVLDAGCGEGHYLAAVASSPAYSQDRIRPRWRLLGFDLSREAVRRAARAVPDALLFVNDVGGRITVASGAVDVLLNLFAPRHSGEFARVVRPGGVTLVGLPAADHLSELRQRLPLLGIQSEKRDRTVERLRPHLRLEDERHLRHSIHLTPEDVIDLVRMSPSYWHLPEKALAPVSSWGTTEACVSVLLLTLRRTTGR